MPDKRTKILYSNTDLAEERLFCFLQEHHNTWWWGSKTSR